MQCFADDNVNKFCSHDTFTSKEDAMRYIADVVMPHPWFLAICLNGKPIGSIFVSPFMEVIGGEDGGSCHICGVATLRERDLQLW